MAVRQYVGARYVPKFYQNSTDPSGTEWEGNRSYEALTVVSYNNDSYTSKIPVPAGIGNPASNPTYWARTGAYNAQVEQYRQEVETAVTNVNEQLNQTTTDLEGKLNDNQTKLEGEMQTLKKDTEQSITDVTTSINDGLKRNHGKYTNAKVITIGDSYGTGYYDGSDHPEEGWPAQLKSITGMNLIDYSYGGSGFVGNQPDHTFLAQLTQAVTDNNTDAELVIISGGSNDCEVSGLSEAINNTLQYAKTNFSSAKILLIWNSINYIYTLDQKNSAIIAYSTGAISNGIFFYNVSPYVRFIPYTTFSDKLHLTATGYHVLALELASLIYTGKFTSYNFNLPVSSRGIICHGTPEAVLITKYLTDLAGPVINVPQSTVLQGDKEFIYENAESPSGYDNLYTCGTRFVATGASNSIGYSEDASSRVFRNGYCTVILADNHIAVTPIMLNADGTGYQIAAANSTIQLNLNAFSSTVPASYFC